jgi:hypothetical protein
MNMEITDKQERGIELLTKGLRRKFPFILGMEIREISEFFIWVTIIVEFTRFLKFYNVPPSSFHLKYGLETSKEYFEGYKNPGYLMGLVNEDHKDDFGNKYNEKLENFLSGLYSALPTEYTTQYDNHPKLIRLWGYQIEVDVDGEFPTHTES